MTRKEKVEIIESMEVMGYWYDGLNGMELRNIEYTPDGIKAYVKNNVGTSKPTYHILSIIEQHTTDGLHNDNIRVNNRRYYLKDCLRVCNGR